MEVHKMKCLKLENSGVIKLVPVNKEECLNDLYRQGFKCVLKNGIPEVVEMSTPKKLNFISDPVVREAITKLSQTVTVKEVAGAVENVKATK